MARTDDQIRLDFIIEGNNARQQLNSIDKEALRLRNQMKGLTKGSKEYTQTEKDLRLVTQRQKELRNQVGLTGMSLRELNSESKRLRAIQQHLTPGTKQFKQTSEELRKVNTRMRELRSGTKATGLSVRNLAGNFNRYIGMAAGFTLSIGAMTMGARRATEAYNNFEKTLTGISASTGLVGSDLEWLGQQAAEMSTAVIDGNVRITQSAQSILEAYDMVATKRPEIQGNAEALNMVTQEAIILSEALGTNLETEIDNVTMVLNQLRLEASDSRRVINTLAAQTSASAADASYFADVLEHAGTRVNSMNISLEETAGAVSAIAPYFEQSTRAGRYFEQVLTRMQRENIGYVDGVFNMEAALDELNSRFDAGENAADIFGESAGKMAEVMVENREEFQRYTEVVTGTNEALEMAAVNTDTNADRLEQAKNKTENAMRELGEQLAPIQVASQNFFAFLANTVASIIKNWETYRDVLIALIATYAAYKAQAIAAYVADKRYMELIYRIISAEKLKAIQIGITTGAKKAATAATHLYSAAKALLTGNTRRATDAIRAFRKATVGTPWGAILAAITAIAGALVVYARSKERATKTSEAFANVEEKVTEQYGKQAAEIEKLTAIVEDGNMPLKKRKEAVERLNEIVPEYNAHLTEEGELIGHNTDLLDAYLERLYQRIYLTALEEELGELYNELYHARQEFEKAREELEEFVETASRGSSVFPRYERAVNDARKRVEELENAINAVQEAHTDAYRATEENTEATEENTEAVEENNEAVEEATKLYDKLKTAISDTEKAIKDINTEMRNLLFEDKAADISDMVDEIDKLQAKLEVMKVQDIMFEGIIEHGGLDEYMDYLTNVSSAAQDEADQIADAFEKVMDSMPDPEEAEDTFWKEFDLRSEVNNEIILMEIERNAFLEKMEKERLERIKDYSLRFADEIASAAFQIHNNRLTDEYNQKINQLNEERDAILANENLTREQQEQINAQYRQREAALKQEQFEREQRAAHVEAAIFTALAMIKAAPNWVEVGLAAAMGAAQQAVIASQPVPQFSKGKYNVTGADDGKEYNATWIGQPKTGLYSRPALFAETGDEIIIDPATTRRIVRDEPQILSAINRVKVPQYAEGTDIPEVPEREATESSIEAAVIYDRAAEKFDRAVDKMVNEGINANIIITELQKELDNYKKTKDDAKP